MKEENILQSQIFCATFLMKCIFFFLSVIVRYLKLCHELYSFKVFLLFLAGFKGKIRQALPRLPFSSTSSMLRRLFFLLQRKICRRHRHILPPWYERGGEKREKTCLILRPTKPGFTSLLHGWKEWDFRLSFYDFGGTSDNLKSFFFDRTTTIIIIRETSAKNCSGVLASTLFFHNSELDLVAQIFSLLVWLFSNFFRRQNFGKKAVMFAIWDCAQLAF